MATFKNIAPLCMMMMMVVALLGPLFSMQVQAQNLCGGFDPPSPGDCAGPINCFRPDPVCGANGVTYVCGCPEANCAGVPVVKLEAC
ncbi:hypothetical protein JCGZ_14155 [Jatropha curcas]|uniref:Kazal-like domain-containing protein n=1 Tax=Jatropha curcas TaxID=180498 RepID=A0A067K994_JATCU|nr:hypothetical protein JCGZ_14155 [Jatropha curcas]